MMGGTDRALDALYAIPPDLSREDWHEAGRAGIAAGLTVDDLLEWSRPASNFKSESDVRAAFRTIRPDGKTGPGTLFYIAQRHGWTPPKNGAHRPHAEAKASSHSREKKSPPPSDLAERWASWPEADDLHQYIVRKNGRPDGLRVIPADSTMEIAGRRVAGWLAVPARSLDGTFRTVQLIPPEAGASKLSWPGARFEDAMFIAGNPDESAVLYIVEGLATAWACWRATGHAAAVTFGCGRFDVVTAALRAKYQDKRLIIVPDRGKESQAAAVARKVGGEWVELPADKPSNYDACDFAHEHDDEDLAELLGTTKRPETEAINRLDIVFADDLPPGFTPPDELVEGLLTEGGGSVWYGESNSGKTYLLTSMGIAVAMGESWLGRRTERGIVVYLATESPSSIRARLQAYSQHHAVKVDGFAIVQAPVSLYESDGDTEATISAIREIERTRGQKVRLVIGDTLARLSAGANENSGEDMGLVLRRFDRIRAESKAHFALIHHSGKNAANGARGWSGIKASVDTEIEVSDTPAGRYAEVTKQRDLAGKGERLGFRLEPVTLGQTKWGAPATACIVATADAPVRTAGKRVSEVAGAILEHLRAQAAGIRKSRLVEHFKGIYDKSAVYRELKRLVTTGMVFEVAGIVAASEEVRNGAD